MTTNWSELSHAIQTGVEQTFSSHCSRALFIVEKQRLLIKRIFKLYNRGYTLYFLQETTKDGGWHDLVVKGFIEYIDTEEEETRYNGTHGQLEVYQVKSDMLMGPEECLVRPVQACIPLPYTDPYYNGLLATYGPQAMIQCPQMLGMANARVPLPLDLPQDEPIYVNAKQYHAILRRRQVQSLKLKTNFQKPERSMD